jgi:hypothetical protein
VTYADFETEVLDTVATSTGTHRGDGEGQTLFTSIETCGINVISYMNDALAGRGRPAPPYVAVQMGQDSHDPEWGVRSRTFRHPLTVGIVAPRASKTPAQIRAMLETLATLIDDGSFTTFQSPPERASIDVSDTNPIYEALGAQSKVKVVAGTLTWIPGLLVDR